VTVAAVVPAAGRGERLGASRPKALVELGGRPLVAWAVDGLLASGVVDAVVVAAPADGVEAMRGALGRADVTVVAGADDRVGSVDAALAVVPESVAAVLVHDAARCLCPPEVVRAVVGAVRSGADAVVPAIAAADTLKRTDASGRVTATVDRTGLVGVQTPQGFAPGVLRRAHDHARDGRSREGGVAATDDAGLVEDLGGSVLTVPGDPRAFKITTPLDLALAEALVRGAAVPP
jgi:2-C-methyl-D-erythritol 4-phosphate cytidylyltransferase